MKRSRFTSLFGTAVFGVVGLGCQSAPQTVATIPGVTPPAATPIAANMLGVAPGGGPPGPVTVWQKLGVGRQQLEACRRNLCKTPAGMLMGRAVAPMSALTGGLIPPFCSPIPTAGELLDPGAIGANSKAKMDKANAEARKKAVEELGGLDCHYWPEAEDALIGALRADRNECVRHTAALVLNRGCCCTKKTIEALNICVSGSEADGHPCEKSARVRAAAAIALQACLERACCPTCPIPEGAVPVPVEEKKPIEEKPKTEGEDPKKNGTKKDSTDANSSKASYAKPSPYEEELDEEAAAKKAAKIYYTAVKKMSMETLLARAKKTLETMPPLPLDLTIPFGHPDYEAAGVRTSGNDANRPTNFFDYMAGKTNDSAMKMTPTQAQVSKATGEAPRKPVDLLDLIIGKPESVKPAATVTTPPVEIKTPASTPEPVKAAPLQAPKMPVKEVQPEDLKPTAVVPQQMPASSSAATVETSPLAMPIQSAPVVTAASTNTVVMKTAPAVVSQNATAVLKMLGEPTDLLDLCTAVNSLTDSDMKSEPKLIPALLLEAEHPCPVALRISCLKALARGKVSDADMTYRLQKLSQEKDRALSHEAIKTLQALNAAQ